METVAVYSESKIRTYGFDLLEGLNLVEMDLTDDDIHDWGKALSCLRREECRLEWMVAWSGQKPSMRLWLLCDDANARTFAGHMEGAPAGGMNVTLRPPVRVDVINFHGPHFGDRYGIADFTLAALESHGMDIIAMTCSISGITLVLPDSKGQAARSILTSVYEIPQKAGVNGRRVPEDGIRPHE